MGNKNKAIDAYISKSADFAKPILMHIRELVHEACPAVEEKIKWGFPHFDYKGEMMCSMAAFKQHCACGFWKGTLIKSLARKKGDEAMGHLGRIKILSDLPSDKKMLLYIKEAMKLNEEGIKLPLKQKPSEKKELIVPDYFRKALILNKKALQVFENFSYSHKKEYIAWIAGAKTEDTRNKRMATALDWIANGKGLNWRYERK
jgi:uncharacterized protein YdeI (YjbR/CyaY-like superfamily)